MHIDPRHLTAIEIIRSEGSLTRAAEVLATSQPALSRLVTNFEQRMGAPIFDRGQQPWRLTRLGETLAQQGRAILRARDRASSEILGFKTGRSGTVHLAGPPFFMDSVIASHLPVLGRRNPGLSFQIQYGYGSELQEAVASGTCDLAVFPLPMGQQVDGLTFHHIYDARNVIACRTGHPILELAYPRPLALLDYEWIVPPEGSPLAQDLRTVLSALDMQEAQIVFAGASLAGVLSFLQQSDCLAVLPELTVRSMQELYNIEQVPIDTKTPQRQLGILSRPLDELDLKTRTCLEYLLQLREVGESGFQPGSKDG